ncbi:glycoside hydrolase family 9 protein [Phenylobacterium deserti]|uniref:Glycoside hydrolase n=1 Tax=Phenylobacterium deserti TaxID=1914756 RepID=A0A328AWY3_9CAUL|nr:glycoside hydrolase family 9 protein [Phenylobacterium deserti]RAK58216.1 glycoside hydrolase [Phenylobacterium deserti]
MRSLLAGAAALALIAAAPQALAQKPTGSAGAPISINDKEYFARQGVNVMVFNDFYPDGHQTGVTVVQHGTRVAANGDLRLETSPGQWSPMPVTQTRTVDRATGTITQTLSYPDPSKDRKGFNPIIYPDLKFTYHVKVTALSGGAFRVTVDLDQPLPAEWIGKVGFNFELFPGELFGKSWLMDGQAGIFPRQPNGPVEQRAGEWISKPMAQGKTLIVAPDEDLRRMTIESRTGQLELVDGRGNHNNAWYIVRGVVPAGATKNAIEWVITPNVVEGWRYQPVIQVSQVGYAPDQAKRVVLEKDPLDTKADEVVLYRLTANGRQVAKRGAPKAFGPFLRYQYSTFDFSDVTAPGMYVVGYRDQVSHPFKIGADVFDRDVWQPTLETFLPNQMCHMVVREKYRIWHGLDHLDDARMAPTDLNHFDGYLQGASTLTKYKPGDRVPGLDAGGWHDAGDYDMRVESQIGTIWLLSKMVTEFGLNYDATAVDQKNKTVDIRVADGKDDARQQIEHGLLSVLGGYRAMGRLYRGIIEPHLSQYVLLGDVVNQTDNLPYDPKAKPDLLRGHNYGVDDDRWVFTEDNPDRELDAAAGLAAASVALRDYDAKLAAESLAAARDIYAKAKDRPKKPTDRIAALTELVLATGEGAYMSELIALKPTVIADIENSGWAVGQVINRVPDESFRRDVTAVVATYQAKLREQSKENPYGVPYKPDIWGAGWTIQEFGVKQWFFHKGWPQLTPEDYHLNALNFVLGVHPGQNNASFASGVGSKSATTAYGTNRADWSYIPGGVISGTALIRPDLPELKVWPYFWQQTEYVLGGGETNYMFLAIAAQQRAKGK